MRWLMPKVDAESVRRLSENLNISPILARLLVLRRLTNPEQANQFLKPEFCQLHNPFEMLGMNVAVRRIMAAIEHQEKILIYGDYDVDGILAVVVLRTALLMLGAEVHHHIPHRIREGYGMREDVIDQAGQQGFSLIISVDTGIRAFAAAEKATN